MSPNYLNPTCLNLNNSHLNSTCNHLNTISVDTPPSFTPSFSPSSSTAFAASHTKTTIANLISDTGATGIYLPSSHASLLTSVNMDHQPITVQLPNNQHLTSTSSGSISIGSLPTSALSTHIFPHLTQPLLGTAQLCDNDLTVIYTRTALTTASLVLPVTSFSTLLASVHYGLSPSFTLVCLLPRQLQHPRLSTCTPYRPTMPPPVSSGSVRSTLPAKTP